MKFKKTDGPVAWFTEEAFYALRNGYLDAALDLLNAEDRRAVEDAGELLDRFFFEAVEQGVIGES